MSANIPKHVQDKGYEIKWPNMNKSKLATLKSNLKSFYDSNLKLDSHTMAAKGACLKLVSDLLTKAEILSMSQIGPKSYFQATLVLLHICHG